MKRYWFAAILATLFMLTIGARSEVLFLENFDYDAGQLTDYNGGANVSGGNWVQFSGTGLLIQCVDGNLSYPSYSASEIGRMIKIQRHPSGQSAEDVYHQFTTQSTEITIYYSLLFRVTHDSMAPDTALYGQWVAMLMPDNSTTTHSTRIHTKMSTTPGTYQIGLRASGNAGNPVVWYPSNLTVGTTYLLVLCHQIVTGGTNDVSRMWINPPLGGNEPSSDLTQVSASDPSNIARLAIRQGSGSGGITPSTPSADIDGIIVATTWQEVTGVAGSPVGTSNARFSLQPVTPNPVSKFTQIKYSLKTPGRVNLSVFNILGQQVATLVDGDQAAGSHTATWRLRDDRGSLVPNGIYFVKLTTGGQSITRRAMVVK